MASPRIQIISVSNVFSRFMFFEKKGDVEFGHKHSYDHATLVSSGSVLVEILDQLGQVKSFKTFEAPNMIFINKDENHKLTSLEDNTTCVCIHALRTIDEEIIDPNFLIEPVFSNNKGEIRNLVEQRYHKGMKEFSLK